MFRSDDPTVDSEIVKYTKEFSTKNPKELAAMFVSILCIVYEMAKQAGEDPIAILDAAHATAKQTILKGEDVRKRGAAKKRTEEADWFEKDTSGGN